ncbi:IS66 family insertion sequence element accessory protein TnpB [Dyadobacter crusticola]|uniref:IS66 family insertion sequence element accessory protein TnpB n=1 Tax=Dyadobacter crusticola TaxID=292407 RepID=UPI0009FB9558|nr:IS66 family insertion sequence element accessory protein TnpB [Dyadobacter crusticola]
MHPLSGSLYFNMLALSHSCRYFLYRSPTDMRFGIYSLAGLVRNELGFDPSSGDVFVFLGKRLNQIRLLQWDRDGFAMYVKKLEQGTFEWPKSENIAITSHRRATPQLTLLLQGVMLDSVRLRKRYQHANQVTK